jgi:predicted enzyme related to lactoylglutathione lyase
MTLNYTDVLITLAATDLKDLVKFYCRLFEQDPNPYIPSVYAEFQLQGMRLGIFQPKENRQQEFTNSAGSGMSICLEVPNLLDAIAKLTALGYPPPGEIITASHGKEIYAYDPAGNRLILHQKS